MFPKHFFILLPCSLEESFELLLSRAIDLIRRESNNASILYCKGGISRFCMSNPLGLKAVCRSCVYVTERAINDFGLQHSAVAINTLSEPESMESCSRLFSSSDSFQKSVALSVSSTVGSLYRCKSSHAQGSKRAKSSLAITKILKQGSNYTAVICNSIETLLQDYRTNVEINLYNGRYYPYMSIINLCQFKVCDFCVVEFHGNRRSRMWLSRNTVPHSLVEQRTRLEAALADPRLKEEDGHYFFQQRRAGIPTTDVSFIHPNSKKFLVTKNKILVSIFLSSPDEFIAFGSEWLTSYTLNPIPFILNLREKLPESYLICVRFHPNQSGDRTGATDNQLRSLQGVENCLVVPPGSPISTYSILDQSSFSVTFGSTIGLEATYWNVTSIEAGIQVWSHLPDVIYTVSTPEQACTLILNHAPPKSRQLATLIGSYFMNPPHSEYTCFTRHPKHSYALCCGRTYLPVKRLTFGFFVNKIISIFLTSQSFFGKKI